MAKRNENYVNLPYVLLSVSAHTPVRGSEQAAGWDLCADLEGAAQIVIAPGEVRKISTGIAIALPEGTFGAIFPRSGLATKKGLALANKVGVIDSDYRGAVIIALKNESSDVQIVTQGERIAQLVVIPCLAVDFKETNFIGTTARGNNGFGSTGTY